MPVGCWCLTARRGHLIWRSRIFPTQRCSWPVVSQQWGHRNQGTSGIQPRSVATASSCTLTLPRRWTTPYEAAHDESPRGVVENVELHRFDDVTAPPEAGFADFLVNPANEYLVGTQQPYFERGKGAAAFGLDAQAGRTDSWFGQSMWMRSSNWRGSTAGNHMLYPTQCVDGLTHQKCGAELRTYLQRNYYTNSGFDITDGKITSWSVVCPAGCAVWSPAFGKLQTTFPLGIIHAVAPFYGGSEQLSWVSKQASAGSNWERELEDCYRRMALLAVSIAERTRKKQDGTEYPMETSSNTRRVVKLAVPFLGSGVRDIPILEGATIAARALRVLSSGPHQTGPDPKPAPALPDSRLKEATGCSEKLTKPVALDVRFVTREHDDALVADIVEIFSQAFARE